MLRSRWKRLWFSGTFQQHARLEAFLADTFVCKTGSAPKFIGYNFPHRRGGKEHESEYKHAQPTPNNNFDHNKAAKK